MFASGRNAVQVQHWLGHHSASSTYVHLLDGDLGGRFRWIASPLGMASTIGGVASWHELESPRPGDPSRHP
jgi:hypothetical protein